MYFIDNKENKPELQYNYYNTLSKKLNETEISFMGKTNNPNSTECYRAKCHEGIGVPSRRNEN